ncbi:MAG: carbohydrate ABC transporter permease [Acholeplasmataceae bacterium]
MDKIKKNKGQILTWIMLIILILLSFYPFYLLIIKSFKTISDDQSNPFGFPKTIAYENYEFAWEIIKPYLLNSFFITFTVSIGIVIVSSFAAYAFSKFEFPYKNVVFYSIISLMMIPGIVTLTSQYDLINKLGLINNHFGVILPSIAGSLPFGIFLLKTSFDGVEKEVIESATIDGANSFQVYFHIMIPFSKPILWTLLITSAIGAWNDYLWPSLVLLKEDLQTLPVGLVRFTDWYYNMAGGYGAPFAAYVISSLPLLILFALASKQFISGLTSGSIKM